MLKISLCLVALAVFPDHVMLYAGLFRLVGLREGERRGKREAGNNETGGNMADHDRLHLKIGVRRID